MAIAGNYSNYSSGDETVDVLVEAVVEIFRDFYVKITPVVNFIKSVDEKGVSRRQRKLDGEKFEHFGSMAVVDEIIEHIMLGIELELSFSIQNYDKIARSKTRKIEFCVMIVDSHENFKKIFREMETGKKLWNFLDF